MGYEYDGAGVALKIKRICSSDVVGLFAARETARNVEKYVPKREGVLRQSAVISPFLIEYTAPYAHYQWEGVSKRGSRLAYHDPSGMTGSHWEQKANKEDIASAITEYLRRL